MADYDPRRSRPRPAVEPTSADAEAAPVEALFGPEPDADPAEVKGSKAKQEETLAPSAGPPRPLPAPRSSAPSPLWQIAPLLAVLSVLGLLVWWLTRRRRGGDS